MRSIPDLTNEDINNYYANNKLFGGVFSIYEIPKKIQNKFYIILLAPKNDPNSGHWTLVFNCNDRCIYFDSFGKT